MTPLLTHVNFERVKHTLAGNDDLLRLFFHRQRPNEGSHFFRGLPLGKLPETLLARPNAGVDDLEEKLTSTRVENEDGTVDRFRLREMVEFTLETITSVEAKASSQTLTVKLPSKVLWIVTR